MFFGYPCVYRKGWCARSRIALFRLRPLRKAALDDFFFAVFFAPTSADVDGLYAHAGEKTFECSEFAHHLRFVPCRRVCDTLCFAYTILCTSKYPAPQSDQK